MITASDVTGVSVDRESKWAVIHMTYEAMAKMMSLPPKCSIVSIADSENNTVKIKVIHGGIKDIKEGGEIPELMPGQGDWTGSI